MTINQNNALSLKLGQYRYCVDQNQKKYLILIISFCDKMYVRITSQENCRVLTAVDLEGVLSGSESFVLSDIMSGMPWDVMLGIVI